MGSFSATLSPRQEQLRQRPAPPVAVLDSPAFNSPAVTFAAAIAVNKDIDNDPSFDAPFPPSGFLSPPSFATTHKLCCVINHHPPQVRQDGRGCSWVVPPAHQVGNLATHLSSTRPAKGRTLSNTVDGHRPPTQPPGRTAHATCSATAITHRCLWE
jgi:hypothetical protein